MAKYQSKLVGSALIHVDAATMSRLYERFPKNGPTNARRDWIHETLNAALDALDSVDDEADGDVDVVAGDVAEANGD